MTALNLGVKPLRIVARSHVEDNLWTGKCLIAIPEGYREKRSQTPASFHHLTVEGSPASWGKRSIRKKCLLTRLIII